MASELDTLDELVAELLRYVQSDDLELNWLNFDPKQSLTDLTELVRHEIPDDQLVHTTFKVPPNIEICADQRSSSMSD